MNAQTRAILWAQWRSLLHAYSKSKLGHVFGAIILAIWYGFWALIGLFVFHVFADPDSAGMLPIVLPGALLLVFLYWQLAPVLMASTGASLEIRKLLVYPVPPKHLYRIEVALRLTAAIEMLILILGAALGILVNPEIPSWSAAAFLPFIAFNLGLSAGVREFLSRLFARKRVREIAVFLFILIAALPQLLSMAGPRSSFRRALQHFAGPWSPWTATADLLTGHRTMLAAAVMALWAVAAYAFGRWQFERSLAFDEDVARATPQPAGPRSSRGFIDRIFRWPSILFRDPLAALIEKELRFLSRAPRFRLVFVMGFTFGLLIWLPMAIGRPDSGGVLRENYLTLVSVYALLLLGDACFFNTFGFDRSAAQAYYVMPLPFRTVLVAKNLAALFFVLLEISAIIAVCSLIRTPITGAQLLEAYAVPLVVCIYLLGVGNLTSTYSPRPVNPSKSMGSGAAGRMQALMVLVYPLAAIPVMLAYAARFAFRSDIAFYFVLGVAALIGAVVYSVAMDSSLDAAERRRETIVAALSKTQGPISG